MLKNFKTLSPTHEGSFKGAAQIGLELEVSGKPESILGREMAVNDRQNIQQDVGNELSPKQNKGQAWWLLDKKILEKYKNASDSTGSAGT